MDPLAVMSLACNIIQVVDFSTRVVQKCQELYINGVLTEYQEMEGMAKVLTGLRGELKISKPQSSDELSELGNKCSDTAVDLIRELQNLKVKGPRSKLGTISRTYKVFRKKEVIDEIWARLREYRNILDTRILIDLRKRYDLLAVQQIEGFESLGKKAQVLIESLAAGSKQVDELAVLVRDESESIKAHVTNELRKHQSELSYKHYQKSILNSLWFPEMKRRQGSVNEAHQKTFQWIFGTEESTEEAQRWDNFVQWLESGQSIYWINGKPGSGKSTLMNYIHQDGRTHRLLEAWSRSKELLAPSFFFWSAGTDLERSFVGLLRSLLYQILEKHSDLTPMPNRTVMKADDHSHSDLELIEDWTERRLQTVLRDVLAKLRDSCRICIFIDGLDEFVGEQSEMITTLQQLQNPDLKICLSSRPDRPFNTAFGTSKGLKLQELTKSDIEIFVSDKLQGPLEAASADDVSDVLGRLVEKAEGVFLWVELVVKEMLKGLQNEDSTRLINCRLEQLPSDIEKFYGYMLSKIESVYREQAAEVFDVLLANSHGSLLNISLIISNSFECESGLSIEDAITLCELTRRRLPALSAGLLETHTNVREPKAFSKLNERNLPRACTRSLQAHKDYDVLDTIVSRSFPNRLSCQLATYDKTIDVHFFHRTFVEFLRNNESGTRFLESYTPSGRNPHICFVKALLVKSKLLGANVTIVPRHPCLEIGVCGSFAYEVMDSLFLAELCAGVAQVKLCEDVDRALRMVLRHHVVQCTYVHWSERWFFGGITADLDFRYICCPKNESSPRSSATQSYYSATADNGNTDLMMRASTKPVEFLGLACSHGLAYYVRHVLSSSLFSSRREILTYLLCCSLWAFRSGLSLRRAPQVSYARRSRWSGSLHLVRELLERGADPNYYVPDFEATIWGAFVERLDDFALLDRSLCGEVVKCFVDKGANLSETAYISREHHLWGMTSCEESMTSCEEPLKINLGTGWSKFRTRHGVTTLYMFKEHLSGTSDFATLETECIAKGVGSSSRCTHIRLFGFDRNMSTASRRYEMTDDQFREFEATAAKYSPSLYEEEPDVCLDHGRQIIRIWRQIYEGAENAQSSDRSDEEDSFYDADEF